MKMMQSFRLFLIGHEIEAQRSYGLYLPDSIDEILLYSGSKLGQQGEGQEAKGSMQADIKRTKVTEGDIQADNGVITGSAPCSCPRT